MNGIPDVNERGLVADYINAWTTRNLLFSMIDDLMDDERKEFKKPILKYEVYLKQKWGNAAFDLIEKSDQKKVREINLQVEMYNQKLHQGDESKKTFKTYLVNIQDIMRS